MERVVVTGATSMIGRALINRCLEKNIEVLAIVRKKSGRLHRLPESDLLKVFECDLDSLWKMKAAEKNYDVFYHFAWANTSKENRDNPVLQEQNLRYSLDAVELAYRLGCRKFVGAGSQAEYGFIDGMIGPDTPANPSISYGIAKYAAGKFCEKRCLQLGMNFIWGRIFSVYGCYDNEGTMLNYAIDSFLKKEQPVFTAATQYWDYLYEDDAGMIFFLLGAKNVSGGIYCIANGDIRPLKEFILELNKCFDGDISCSFARDTEGYTVSLRPDVSSLKKEIQYTPQTTFRQGISKVIEYRKRLMENK